MAVIALKTNLLMDVLGAFNLGVEVPIDRACRFSAAGNFLHGHTRIDNKFALQGLQGTVEGRYWFDPRQGAFTGWNMGLYGTWNATFDLQWGEGWQGDGFRSIGLVGGYSVWLSPRFNLDLSLMGGWVYIPEMRGYDRPRDGRLIWRETVYHANRILPTEVRANLIWLIRKKSIQ